jgi:alpha-beta hydrolase superfamily lysophospholipase
MRYSDFHFEGMNGISLYSQYWLPEVPPRAVIAIVHGFGEHSGRYMNIVDPMVSNQYGVYGYDLRGHGNSPGQRGHIDSWVDYRVGGLSYRPIEFHQDGKSTTIRLPHLLTGS